MNKLAKIIFSIILFCTFNNIYSQSITWEKIYGYPNSDEGAYDICESTDGNFFVVGNSGNNFVNGRIYVLKINQFGDTLWTKKYNVGHYAYAVAPTNDCGCVMAGYGIDSLYTLKINCDGNILWQKTYPTRAICFDIKKVSDGGYILCGYNLFKGFFMKIDSIGNMKWEKNYTVSNQMGFASCIEAIDGGYIAGGYVLDPDTLKVVIKKISIDGDSIWENRFKILDRRAALSSIIKLSDHYLIFGSTVSKSYISKINILGNLQYSYLFGELTETLYDAKMINSNKFVTTSEYYQQTSDSSFVINRICDSLGNIIMEKYISSAGYVSLQSILSLQSKDIIFAGINKPVPGSNDDYAYIIRTDSLLFSKPLHINQISNLVPEDFKLYQNYPNPFNPETWIKFDIVKPGLIKIIIYDLTGKEIQTLINENLMAGRYEVKFNAKNISGSYSSGVYICKLIFNQKHKATLKMLLIK